MQIIKKNPQSLRFILFFVFISLVITFLGKTLGLKGLPSTLLIIVGVNLFPAVMFNYPQLMQGKKSKKLWFGIFIIFLIACLLFSIATFNVRDFRGYYSDNPDLALFTFETLAIQGGIFLLSAHFFRDKAENSDTALLLTFNRYLSHIGIYTFFALATLIVFSLGFWLISLTEFSFPDFLENNYVLSAFSSFFASSLLLLLLLIPIKSRPTPLPYLFLFQYISVGFVLFYLTATLFAGKITIIGSGVRLLIAGILWVFSIICYDPKKPRLYLNIMTAVVGLILVIFSIRGILIRIEAFSLSENRCYALLIAIALGIAHLAGLIKIILQRRNHHVAERMNTTAIILLCVYLAVIIILPVKQWAFNAQKQYYLSSSVNRENFKEYHLSRDFGKAGEALSEEILSLNFPKDSEGEKITVKDKIRILPKDLILEDDLRQKIDGYYDYDDLWRLESHDSLLTKINPDHDNNTEEYLFFLIDDEKNYNYEIIHLIKNKEGNFYSSIELENLSFSQEEYEELVKSLKNGDIYYTPPVYHYDDINIGTVKIPVINLE